MNKVIKITGLDCANCARELEEELNKIEGVSAVVDFMAQKVVAECTEASLEKIIYCCNHFEDVKVVEEVQSGTCGDTEKQSCCCGHDHKHNCHDHGHDCCEHELNAHNHHGHSHNNEHEECAVRHGEQRVYGEKIKIEGLCCANCARELEEDLNKIEGVSATVDFVNLRVILNAATPEAREKAIFAITHFEDVKIVGGNGENKKVIKQHLREIICIVISVIFFIPAFVFEKLGLTSEILFMALSYSFYAVSYLAVGYKVLWNTVRNIVKGKIFDENFLMTIASIGAVILGIFSPEGDGFAEGVAVMLLYSLGELLQSLAVGSSRNSITKLMGLKSETATVIVDGEQRTVSPEDLICGDVILIKAGEKVPADCRIIKGESALDMKSLNGEPLPREVGAGSEILSGSINLSGALEAEVIREYRNSAAAKILELVENSTAKKSKPEKFITKFAKYYTPVVCIAAILVAAIVPTILCAISGAFVWGVYSEWIYKALTFLVISCPCALVISVPLSYFGGIGRCAKFGILVKGSTCLDELALAKVAAFDKTGTLTEGAFRVAKYTDELTLSLAAAAEKYSSHPIAAAFAEIPVTERAEEAEEFAGMGVKCTINGKTVLCGNAKLMNKFNVAFQNMNSLSTVIYVACDGLYTGAIEIDDCIKPEAKEALAALKAQGVEHTVMLTGDLKERAKSISAQAGLDAFDAELLPDMKLAAAEKLKERGKLIYVGDGINDAPVMTAADCAVSMGKVGSDAAIEASDVVLVTDSLNLLPKGRKIARGTRSIVMQNIIGSLIIKLAIMVCGVAIPAFPLIISIIADVGVMLIAVLNAMRTALIK